MLSAIQRTIAEHDLVARGDRVLVAISGGPDSTALLFGLARLAQRLGIELRAATVDHGLRPEAAAEAAAVARTCAALGIPCEVLRVEVRRRAHVSIQDAARRARAAVLTEAAARLGCQRVALGHTADDQAETVLFRIVRGTGLAGLAGIPYRRDRFIRPLLDVRRAQVLSFLRRRRIAFVEDPSNRDPRFARSRVRADWLPFLARENPRIVEALLSLAADSRGPAFAAGASARARGRPGRPPRASGNWRGGPPGPSGCPSGVEPPRSPTARSRWGPRADRPIPTARPIGPPPPCSSADPGCYRWQSDEGIWLVDISLARGRFRDQRTPAGRPTRVSRSNAWPRVWPCAPGGPGTACGRVGRPAGASFRTCSSMPRCRESGGDSCPCWSPGTAPSCTHRGCARPIGTGLTRMPRSGSRFG